MKTTEWSRKATDFAPMLIVAAERGTAMRLSEMMRGLGPVPDWEWAGSEDEAWRCMKMNHPELIFIEQPGREIDGLALVKRLRESDLMCRQAPVIMMSDEATVPAIRAAQAAGAHEFLIRPFSAVDLAKRLEVLCVVQRDWVQGKVYVGPDRRRFNSAAKGPERRGRAKGPPA